MIKLINHKNVSYHLVLMFLCTGIVTSLCAEDIDPNQAGIGRKNPFANLAVKEQAPPPQIAEEVPVEAEIPAKSEKPELFVETVALDFINTESLEGVIRNMLSEYGNIASNGENNELIICDTRENLEKITNEIRFADRAPEQKIFVETITLKFLEADNLQNAVTKMLTKYGSISTDKPTNSLIVCDTKDNLAKISEEIRKADHTPEQIMIEVVILDVQLNDDTEIGVNWDILNNKITNYNYRQSLGFTDRLASTIQDGTTTGDATAFNTTGSGGDFTIVHGKIRNVIHLLQEKKNVEILASPRVMVVSGQTANVEAIEEVPYTEQTETSGGGSYASTSFKDVGVKLKVNATLTDKNLIHLIVESEQKVQTSTSSSGIPVVDARKASTSLLLSDGQVVVMGGLRRKETKLQTTQIPILGDIPILGILFKTTNKVINNSELMVFLAPHIYKGETIEDNAMEKFNELNDRKMLSLPEIKDGKDELISILMPQD